MTEAVDQATEAGIAHAKAGIPTDMKEAALTFFYGYAKENRYFTGGDVLSAWRETHDPMAHRDWRNKWGAICRMAHAEAWVHHSGRIRPTTKQSHARTLVLWESAICADATQEEHYTDQHKLDELYLEVSSGKLNLARALRKAYELGAEV